MVICESEHGIEARSGSDMGEHEVAAMAYSLPQEQPETSGAGAACWGTCEELLLVSAVKRHGVSNWNLISSELKARAITLNVSPLYFSETACKHKYDILRGRFASCSSSTMSQDEDVGNDMHWFEELRKIRVAHLKRELEHYDGSIGSLQVKIKKLKAEKAGDISANKQLGKSIADPPLNDQKLAASSCEVPVQCSSNDEEFGKDMSKISDLKPCSQHLRPSSALDSEKNVCENASIRGPVNLQQFNVPECDQWHDAPEELQDASPGPTDITVDADVHRDLHQLENTTESSHHEHGVELDNATVCLGEPPVTTEPPVMSEGWVHELQGVEAAGVAVSTEENKQIMKLPESEQADIEQGKHLVNESAESLSRDHEAGRFVPYSYNDDKSKAGVEDLHIIEQAMEHSVRDESIYVRSDFELEGNDRNSTATADAMSFMDNCEDGHNVDPEHSDVRNLADGHSTISPTLPLVSLQPSGLRNLGEVEDKEPEISNVIEDNSTPLVPEENVIELQKKTSENVVDSPSPQNGTEVEAGQSTQALETAHQQNNSPIVVHGNIGDAHNLHTIDESLSGLAQGACCCEDDKVMSCEQLPGIPSSQEDLPNFQVAQEVTTLGSENTEAVPEIDIAAADAVGISNESEMLGVSVVVPVENYESSMHQDVAINTIEKPESDGLARSSALVYLSDVDLKDSSPKGHIVIALDEPTIGNSPTSRSTSVLPINGEGEMMSRMDGSTGLDAVSDLGTEHLEAATQTIVTSDRDVACGEYDGNENAHASSANAMDLLREVYGTLPDTAPESTFLSVELVQNAESEENAPSSKSSLPSVMDASNLADCGAAKSFQVENGMPVVEETSDVVDQPSTGNVDVEVDLGHVSQDSVVRHNTQDVEQDELLAGVGQHLDTGGSQVEAAVAGHTSCKTGSPLSLDQESDILELVPHLVEEGHPQHSMGCKNVKESPLAALVLKSGSLPVGHTETEHASDLGKDIPDLEGSSIDKDCKLAEIILDVKLEISKESSLEVMTPVSRQLVDVISEGSRGKDLDISRLNSPNASEGRYESNRGLDMESTKSKSLILGSAKVKEEIEEYVRGRDLQESRERAPISGIKPKAEPSSPEESLADGLESKMPSSHEGSDSVQEQYKDGGDHSGEGEGKRQGARDYGESHIDKSEAGSPVDGTDEMSPSSRRYRREPRVPGKLVPLLEVLRNVCNHKSAYLFKSRPEEPRYNLLIRRHLDLTIVRARLEEGTYTGSSEFFRDLLLIFNNAMVYYACGSTEFLGAKALFSEATKELNRICQTEALLKRDGPATRTRELKKPKTVVGLTPSTKVVIPSPMGGGSSGKLVSSNPSVMSLPDSGSRKRPGTRLGTLETSTNSDAMVDSEAGAARSASVNILGGPSTSRAEEARDSHEDDQEVNGNLKGGKKLHVGGGSSRVIPRREEREGMLLKNGVNKGLGRAKLRDVKDAEITKRPALPVKAAVGGKLKAERETERKREREKEKEKEKVKVKERDDIDDDDFLLRKGKSLAKLKDQEIVQGKISETKPASKARASTAVRSASNSHDTLAQSLVRPARGARKAASSVKESARPPEQPAKKRVRK